MGYNVKYQWNVKSGLFPSDVTGINTSNLIIPEVRSFHGNKYTCKASNEGDYDDTKEVYLKVVGMNAYLFSMQLYLWYIVGLPEVTIMVSSQSVEVTHTAVFTAKAAGLGQENFTYHWQRTSNKTTIFNESTLVLTNVTKSENYICIVTNEYGDTDSKTAYLHVTSKGIIY